MSNLNALPKKLSSHMYQRRRVIYGKRLPYDHDGIRFIDVLEKFMNVPTIGGKFG